MSKKIAETIIQHPDKDELIAKLLANVPPSEITEWLAAKYTLDGEKKFIISTKSIITFKKDYLDFYNIVREDIVKTKSNLTAEQELQMEIQGSPKYHRVLEKYINNELDIKLVVKRCVAAVELRVEQMYDLVQEDPRNIKMDRTLKEWFDTMITLLEKYDNILNGSPDQINIQNNINIQVVDQHINVVYNVIKEILSRLDYDTSLLFIDLFNEEMKKLKPSEDTILPQDKRLSEAKILSETVSTKLQE
jgi:hypothetical protein